MDLLADLQARGLIHATTDREALAERLSAVDRRGPITIYYGCDPTADSLHHGNLIGLVMLRRFQQAGHRALALAGGATGMIGDPSERSTERNLLDDETLDRNVAAIKAQIARIVELDGEHGQLVDNRDWTQPMSVLEFLRDVGRYATVNQMLARESVRARLDSEHGISFTEFSYMLLQANDYRWLYDHFGCELQIGGSDQWGNIVSGVDLIRRTRGATVHALAWPLLTDAAGSKLGKSSGARVWLDPARTSPYQWHQHWMQLDDAELEAQYLVFSLRPVDEIQAVLVEHRRAPERRTGQRALADEMTALVHGSEAAAAAAGAADVLFGADPARASEGTLAALAAEVPASTATVSALEDVIALLAATGVAASKSEARRLLEQRSIRANGTQLGPDDGLAGIPLLHERFLLLRRGKRSYHLVEVTNPRTEVDAVGGVR
jgi:tyrosyl-tRNA synthetase